MSHCLLGSSVEVRAALPDTARASMTTSATGHQRPLDVIVQFG